MSDTFSISPAGEKFTLPVEGDYITEFDRLKERVQQERDKGRQIQDLPAIQWSFHIMVPLFT